MSNYDKNQGGVYRPKLDIDGQFTLVPNDWIRKSNLSPAAMLLYIYLSGHEPGYDLRFPQIKAETRLGDKALRSALKELTSANWLSATRTKRPNGTMGTYRYEVKNPPLDYGDVSTMPLATVAEATHAKASVAEGSHLKREIKENTINKNKAKNVAHLIPDDWAPNSDDWDSMHSQYPWVDLQLQTDAFNDYWRSIPESKAKKTDWDRTWKNWIRRVADQQKPKDYNQTQRKHQF